MCVSGEDGPDAFRIEFLSVVEINADERIVARVVFDPDDIEAAFTELDARYLAGEAAAHAAGWSVISRTYAAFNRHELPATTPDWVNIDHRRGIAFEPGDHDRIRPCRRELHVQTASIYIEAVHRLTHLGAVVTQVMKGTSQDGFDAEWREIDILTVDGDLINRCEIFDETDLDAALARFDELHPQAPRLENAASHVAERLPGVLRGQRLERDGGSVGGRLFR